MEVLLSAGLGVGVLMFFLLLFKRRKKREDYLFLSWIAVMLLQITFYEITIYRFELRGIWAIASFGLPLLGAPLLFLYISALTGLRINWKTVLAHFSVYFIYVILLFCLQKYDDITIFASNGYFEMAPSHPKWMLYYAYPLAISGLVYCLWDLLLLKKHRKTIVGIFSFDENINLKWVSYIVYAYFILFVVATFLIFGAIHFSLLPMENAFAFVGIALSTMLVAFGFYGFRQTSIFTNFDLTKVRDAKTYFAKDDTPTYSKSGLDQDKIKVLANELARHMEDGKPFLNEDLSLPILSQQSNLTQAHLSQIINQYFGKNFYDFVNYYRVEAAKKMLRSPKFDHLSVLGIAFDCGFKSKSSFNRYFKKYTGIAPSDFRKL